MIKATTIIASLLIIVLCTQYTMAQTCKIGTLFNQSPKQCTDCTTCTGANPTCATRSDDLEVSSNLILLTGDCRVVGIEQACSRYDPKNQKYVNNDGSYRICKAWCEKRKSTCNDPTDCSNYPTTDCWNNSNTMVLSMGTFILILISILLF
ncbi:predicted protein [Naegleria gruberi]|uniref:Predicted protein n=1 Tax=Naegleria gruberi TaxID=5762 RepID=D2W2E2_NAEGR|nr:uncharacterized protein NAEGRDRAFT_75557 [Naegleria gruberi]EFC36697.1 predicted protein [Naegleria gruberi]|eukprot:XP_002669441.1 predicted protein [Naegleria gruberi strain NEG-M]